MDREMLAYDKMDQLSQGFGRPRWLVLGSWTPCSLLLGAWSLGMALGPSRLDSRALRRALPLVSRVALVAIALLMVACSRSDHASKRKALDNAKADSERNQKAIQNTLNALRREGAAQSATPSATPR